MKLALRSLALLALAVIASVHAQNDARNASGFLPGVGAPVDSTGSGAVSGGPSSIVGTVAPANMTSPTKNGTSSTSTRKNSTSTTSGSSKSDASTSISGGKSNATASTPAPTTSASASAGVVAGVVTLAITAAASLH